MKVRKAIRSAKLSSSISVVCLVILVGVTILSSVFTQATTHFAYAKKSRSDKSSTGSDSGSGSSSGSGSNSNPSNANSNPPPNPDNTGGTTANNGNPSNANSNPSSNPDNTGGSQSQAITGSTNQQQCPSGEHFDSKKNKCVKDTIKPANITSVNSTIPGIRLGAKCLVGEHLDEFGRCSTAAESVHQPLFAPLLKLGNGSLAEPNKTRDYNSAAKCLIGQHFENLGQKCVPDSSPTNSVQNPGNSYVGSAAKCLIGQHLDALGRCVNDISIGPGGIKIGTHTLSSSSTTPEPHGGPSTTGTTTPPNADGSCPTGYHIDNNNPDSPSCVKDTPSTTTETTTGTGGEAKQIPPNPDGTCPTGYHIHHPDDRPDTCILNTPSTTGTTTGTGATPSQLPATPTCTAPAHLDNGKCVGPSGVEWTPPNEDGTCPKGYHHETATVCILDTPSTTGTTTGTGATPSQLPATPTCTGDTHLDNGKCVGNDVRLPSGDCVPGYHLGSKPDAIQLGRFVKLCVKDTPSTGTGTPSQPIPLGDGSFQLPTVQAGPVDVFTGERACPSGSHKVILSSPQFSCVVDNVQCPSGTSQVGDRCVPPSKSTPTQPGNTGGSTTSTTTPSTTGTTTGTTPSSKVQTTGTGTTTGGNKSSTNTPSTTNTNTVINQNTVRNQAMAATASPSSGNTAAPAYTQGQSMSMWSLSLGKSNFPKDGLRLLANLKPFATIGVPYTLDISFNLPSGNLSLIAAQITNAGPQHAVILPINKTSEGTAGESLYQAELGQTLTGINPFTKQPDTIPVGGVTDLLLWNSSPTDIAFNDDSGATMTLVHK